ncbi:MAG TPA: hypothetical protein VM716_10070 [Gemmatimonadales bacterium]|nr:hypothetical protein [Gemmatimonadales bacterium]
MTFTRLRSSALREWDRLCGATEAARREPRRLRSWVAQLLRFAVKVVVVALLPFVALVRVAVFLYEREGWPTALALAGGAACTAVVVTTYGAWAWHRFTGRVRLGLVARRIAVPFVVAYCAYALVYLSSANAKSAQVRAYYGSLHPLLRVGLSTLIVLDHDAVITDLARRPEDYRNMGLPSNDGSLHLVQRDGYAHAADLRTAGRGFLRNRVVQLYMWGLGFSTLRHTGTADHLHVELPLP